MMEDVEYKDKIMKNLVIVLWFFLIIYMEVWGVIFIKGFKNCILLRMNYL